MSDVVLDANVIVGLLDDNDTLCAQAKGLVARLRAERHQPVFIDFLLGEALSALCRRSFERKKQPLDLGPIVEWVQEQRRNGLIFRPVLTDDDLGNVLDLVQSSRGELNFNDARLVVMQRNADIGDVASFDTDFDRVEGFRRLS
jgi:predicted nucleic acid-binding protein